MSAPGRFALPHLSEDAVAAFADGVLSVNAAERARRHCGECEECATAVRGQREAAMMLRSAQVPRLPSGLLARLAGLPMSTPLPPPAGGLPTALGPDGEPVLIAHSHQRGRGGPSGQVSPRNPADPPEEHEDPQLGVESTALPQPGRTRGVMHTGQFGVGWLRPGVAGQALPRATISRAVLPLGMIASAAVVLGGRRR